MYWDKEDNFKFFKKYDGLVVSIMETRKKERYKVSVFDDNGLEYDSDLDKHYRNYNALTSSDKAINLAKRIEEYHCFFSKNDEVDNYQIVNRNLVINSKVGIFVFFENYSNNCKNNSSEFSKAISYISSNGYSPETKIKLINIVGLNEGFFQTALLK